MKQELVKTLSLTALLVLGASVGACTHPQYSVVDRSVVGIKDGGTGELWIVMTENNRETNGKYAIYRKGVYVVYHCIPKGCKRVGELEGSKIWRRSQ